MVEMVALELNLEVAMVLLDLVQILVKMELAEMVSDRTVEQEEASLGVLLVDPTIVKMTLTLVTMMMLTATILALVTTSLSIAKTPGSLSTSAPINPSVAESMLWADQRLAMWM